MKNHVPSHYIVLPIHVHISFVPHQHLWVVIYVEFDFTERLQNFIMRMEKFCAMVNKINTVFTRLLSPIAYKILPLF